VLQYLITHFSDFQLACLGSFFLHESVFFLSGLPFIWLERAGWMSNYKIQVCSCWWLLLSQCWMILHFVLQDGLLLLFYLKWALVMAEVNYSDIVYCLLWLDTRVPSLAPCIHFNYSLHIVSFVLRTMLSRSLQVKKSLEISVFNFFFLICMSYMFWRSNNAFWGWLPQLDWLIHTKHVHSKYVT